MTGSSPANNENMTKSPPMVCHCELKWLLPLVFSDRDRAYDLLLASLLTRREA
ncbi:MAG: hypothetical protein H6Q41_5946 [Deltaproteobacteria bacterium]|jgi:hypothetical protein|nr:hypothetical protein [Deltaproteobacteria bacterium]